MLELHQSQLTGRPLARWFIAIHYRHAAGAADKAASQHPSSRKLNAKMTCEEFLGLEVSFQPEAVSWAVAYGENGEPEVDAVNVEDVETVVPFVVQGGTDRGEGVDCLCGISYSSDDGCADRDQASARPGLI